MKIDVGIIIKGLAGIGCFALLEGAMNFIYNQGRESVVHDIYHKYDGFVYIPGKTDKEGNWIEDRD